MCNAKVELESACQGKEIFTAQIFYACSVYAEDEDIFKFILSVGASDLEYEKFLNSLDFEYDDGFGGQHLFGYVWFTDGTWLERGEYDGSEWWCLKERPVIKEYKLEDFA